MVYESRESVRGYPVVMTRDTSYGVEYNSENVEKVNGAHLNSPGRPSRACAGMSLHVGAP